MMRLSAVALIAMIPALPIGQAQAGEFIDRLGANERGLLAYCQSKGFAGAKVVATARDNIVRELRGDVERERSEGITRPHLDPALAGSIEAMGRQGQMLDPDDNKMMPFATFARRQHLSEAGQCHAMITGMIKAENAARAATPPPVETPEERAKTDDFIKMLKGESAATPTP